MLKQSQIIRNIAVLLVGLMVLLAGPIQAATYYVATTGNDSSVDGSAGNPWLTISNAVAKAAGGDTVLVAAGTYTVVTNVNLATNLTVRSQSGRGSTAINAAGARCVYMNHAQAVLDGFTLSNGVALAGDRNGYGGGAYVDQGNLLNCDVKYNRGVSGGGAYLFNGVATNCVFTGNRAEPTSDTYGGGGVFIGAAASLLQCRLIDNVSSGAVTATYGYGGGMFVAGVGSLVQECVLASNHAAGRGGGISFNTGASVVTGCVIEYNTASGGGGVNFTRRAGLLTDCTIRDNSVATGGSGGGIDFSSPVNGAIVDSCRISNNWARFGGGIASAAAAALVSNCVINANTISADSSGGAGLYMSGSTTAVWCRIVNNIATNKIIYGVGVNIADGAGVLSHCTIQDNIGTNGTAIYGGGVRVKGAATLKNCLITGNRVYNSGIGGGLSFNNAGTACKIESCTIASNYAKVQGGGVFFAGDGADTISNSVVYHNNSPTDAEIYDTTGNRGQTTFYYSCSGWLTSLNNNNITNDPAFVDLSGDYRLDRLSQCINAGAHQDWMDAGVDLDGRPRIDRMGRQVDMGCFEYIHRGTLFGIR